MDQWWPIKPIETSETIHTHSKIQIICYLHSPIHGRVLEAEAEATNLTCIHDSSAHRRPWWLAHLYVFCKGGNSCCLRRDFDLCLTTVIDLHGTYFPESITPVAAPRALLRFLYQPPGGWPTFTFFVKVGIHAACVGILIFALPQ
jgi:hypothetical protein